MENNGIVQIGEDNYDISDISDIFTDDMSFGFILSDKIKKDIEKIINKYSYEISGFLNKPADNFSNSHSAQFSIIKVKGNFEAEIKWKYMCRNSQGDAYFTNNPTVISFQKDIIPAINKLLAVQAKKQQRRNVSKSIFDLGYFLIGGGTTVFEDVPAVLSSEGIKELTNFVNKYTFDLKKKILIVTLKNKVGFIYYFQDDCGFDIFEKEKEINEMLLPHKKAEKEKNSYNRGEEEVKYQLKWITSAIKSHIVTINNDCESQYRCNCILLKNSKFIDEVQEYDHILVTSAGVVIIETKDWKGLIEITSDGKWIRHNEDNGTPYGVASPVVQMRRHEQLMKSFLPSVPIYSILCYSNPSAIIKGKDNINECEVINIEQLESKIKEICAVEKYSDGEVDEISSVIETYKINKM